ncbi:hypothetical protein MRB53_006817 [Persea americana]|uniref:Uncharacterized protein n=1 Tax=Persea americana TaxID=3435 RepID=A0ACC2MH78_PERAE|nr:hypothetical protein MRB53_006817 [Persea americana]
MKRMGVRIAVKKWNPNTFRFLMIKHVEECLPIRWLCVMGCFKVTYGGWHALTDVYTCDFSLFVLARQSPARQPLARQSPTHQSPARQPSARQSLARQPSARQQCLPLSSAVPSSAVSSSAALCSAVSSSAVSS